ncbi:bacterial transcriptional activator domain-containing protein [Nocardioides sp. YIM 152588]|uniref:AfsR/SARP family transcriptional regulator n=1 Tax=Nocardioides sp. YIM 152588 TaxID=3158259 RepID=UPI0032E3D197
MARLYLTGGLLLDGPDRAVTADDFPGQQGRLAFAALAVERRPLAHGELADIVWDEAPPPQWKSALAAVVSKIRALVGAAGLDGAAAVSSSGGAYRLTLPPGTWVDLEDAIRRVDRAEGALRHGDDLDAAREATVAAAILRRPFLTGVDNRWVDGVRRHQLETGYRSAVALATAWIRLGDHQLAATTAGWAIRLDPLRETGYRLLIEAERGRGDHSAALRAFTRCVDTLAEELDVPPSPETLALAASLRRRR